MIQNPLVSIIVPVYNVENYLSKCLDSLIHQSYSNIEIIVVNDGSTDGSLNIIHEYSEIDKRVILINTSNGGLSSARNLGLESSKGEYVCYVDSDDWLDVNCIEEAVKYISKENYDVVLWGYIKEFGKKSIPVSLTKDVVVFDSNNIKLLYQRIIGPVGLQLKRPELLDSYTTAWGKLIKSSLIKNNCLKFLSTKYIGTGEDLLFNIQLFAYVKTAVLIPECYNHYRKNNITSVTSIYKNNLFRLWGNLQDNIFSVIHNDALFEKAFYNRVACTMIGLGLNECYSDNSYAKKKENIKEIFNNKRYKYALKQLELKYFPIHWKIFFYFCKRGFLDGYLFMIMSINKIKNK